jgi:hypothetical protein
MIVVLICFLVVAVFIGGRLLRLAIVAEPPRRKLPFTPSQLANIERALGIDDPDPNGEIAHELGIDDEVPPLIWQRYID